MLCREVSSPYKPRNYILISGIKCYLCIGSFVLRVLRLHWDIIARDSWLWYVIFHLYAILNFFKSLSIFNFFEDSSSFSNYLKVPTWIKIFQSILKLNDWSDKKLKLRAWINILLDPSVTKSFQTEIRLYLLFSDWFGRPLGSKSVGKW